jgi:hypothetical protein
MTASNLVVRGFIECQEAYASLRLPTRVVGCSLPAELMAPQDSFRASPFSLRAEKPIQQTVPVASFTWLSSFCVAFPTNPMAFQLARRLGRRLFASLLRPSLPARISLSILSSPGPTRLIPS